MDTAQPISTRTKVDIRGGVKNDLGHADLGAWQINACPEARQDLPKLRSIENSGESLCSELLSANRLTINRKSEIAVALGSW